MLTGSLLAASMSRISLKEQMSIDYVQTVVNAVRDRVECGRTELCPGPPTLPLCQYLLPGEQVPDIVSWTWCADCWVDHGLVNLSRFTCIVKRGPFLTAHPHLRRTGVLTVFAHHRFVNQSDGRRIIPSSLFACLANQYFGINEQSVTNKSFRNTRLFCWYITL